MDSKKDAKELLGRGIAQLTTALELVRRAVAELDDVAMRAEEAGIDPKGLMLGPLAEPYGDMLDAVEDTVLSLENAGLYDPVGADDEDGDDAEDEEFDVDMGDIDDAEESDA